MATRSWYAFAAGAVIAGILVGGVASAQGTTFPEEVTACMQGRVLQVPDENGDCVGGADPITWNIQGPVGPQGPPGQDGEDGNPAPLDGYENVEKTYSAPGLGPGQGVVVSAFCAPGKAIISGGGRSAGVPGIVIESSYPFHGNAWGVTYRNVSDVPKDISVTTYAICAYIS